MARPKVDADVIRVRFFEAADAIIRSGSGTKLRLADVASAVGMTQSNAYRYFQSKDELIEALAERWFADVEKAARDAVLQTECAHDAIRGWLIATMRTKTRMFDRDPATFLAYLELAKDYPEAVARHTDRLRGMILSAVGAVVDADRLGRSIETLEDATILFRNPYLIAAQRSKVTEVRAHAVLDAVFLFFAAKRESHSV